VSAIGTPLLLGPALVVAAVLGIALLEALTRRAELGAALLLGSAVVQAVFVSQVPSLYLPGGTRVQLTDVCAGLVLGAALARLLRARRLGPYQRWLLVLGAVLLISLARGVLAFGMQTSVDDFRQYIFYAAGALYLSTFAPSPPRLDRIGGLWLAMAVPLMALVCLRWLAVFAGVDLGVPHERFGADRAIRVIDGPYTFFLAHAFVLTLPAWLWRDQRSARLRRLGLPLLLFVMLLDRRTVWLALIVGAGVLLLRERRLGRRMVLLVAAGAVVTAVAFAVLAGAFSGGGAEPVARSASSTGTIAWRVQGWSELFSAWARNPADWVVGQPFGSGFAREVEGSEVFSHPHNFFLETLLRTGLVGLAALVALTAGLLRALWRARDTGPGLLAPGVFPALLAMQFVWFVTWAPGAEQGIVTGLAVALADRPAPRRRAGPAPLPPAHAGATRPAPRAAAGRPGPRGRGA
jgi:O-antigen ligase